MAVASARPPASLLARPLAVLLTRSARTLTSNFGLIKNAAFIGAAFLCIGDNIYGTLL